MIMQTIIPVYTLANYLFTVHTQQLYDSIR